MTTGHAKTLILHVSGLPGIEMEKMKIDLKDLNILIGQNGIGKSLVMKITWVLNTISQLIAMKQPNIEAQTQYILDHSIPDNGMLGNMSIEYTTGATVTVNLLEGKINGVHWVGFEKINEPTPVIYMSTEMRLFTSIKQYLALRKVLGVEKMAEHYKLYDIIYVERLIQKAPMSITGVSARSMLQMVNEGSNNELEKVEFSETDFTGVWKDGSRKPLSQLGSGEQAVINMVLGGL